MYAERPISPDFPIPMGGCAPCAASMRGTDAFDDGTEKPSWWSYVPFVALAVIAGAGVIVWKLGK